MPGDDILTKMGLPGIVIMALAGVVVPALCWYILRIEDRHRREIKERDVKTELMIKEVTETYKADVGETRKMIERQFAAMNDRTDKTNEVIRETGNILYSLKTIFENSPVSSRRSGGRRG